MKAWIGKRSERSVKEGYVTDKCSQVDREGRSVNLMVEIVVISGGKSGWIQSM